MAVEVTASMTATAQQAMPSRRPSAPRPSARRPFTVTGPPAASLRRRCISGLCGAIFGISHTTIQLENVYGAGVGERWEYYRGKKMYSIWLQGGKVVRIEEQ